MAARLFAALWLLLSGCAPAGLPVAEIVVGGQPLRVEIAADDASRSRGLMGREVLPAGTGMLFVYPDSAVRAFWMKDTPLPLDIAYLDGSGRVIDIQTMTPFSLEPHRSAAPARYALEVPAGWFAAHGVAPGAAAELGCARTADCPN